MSYRRSDAMPVSWSRLSNHDVTLTLIAVFSAALYVNSTFQLASASVTSLDEFSVTEPTTLTDHLESSSSVTPNEVRSPTAIVSDLRSSSSTDMTTDVVATSGSVSASTSALFTTVQRSSTAVVSKTDSLLLAKSDSILRTSPDNSDKTEPTVKTSGNYSGTLPTMRPENWSTTSTLRNNMLPNETDTMKAETAALSTSGSLSVTSAPNYVTSFTVSLNSTSDLLSDSNMINQQSQGISLQLALGIGLGVGGALLLIFVIVLTVCIVSYDRERSCKRTTYNDAESSYTKAPSSGISIRSTKKRDGDSSNSVENVKMSERSGDDVIRYAKENETSPTKPTARVKIRHLQQRASIVELASGKELSDDNGSSLNGSSSSPTVPMANSTHPGSGNDSAKVSKASDKRRDKEKPKKQSKIRRHQRNSISQLARQFSDDTVAVENSQPSVAAAAPKTAETVTTTTHGPNTSTDNNVSTNLPSVSRNISVDHELHSTA